MFQGENLSQITRDSSGLPTGFNQNIYRDIDASLELARKYDLYYHFTLFSTAMGLPSNWIDNATGRERFAFALAPLFVRYKDEPRHVLSPGNLSMSRRLLQSIRAGVPTHKAIT